MQKKALIVDDESPLCDIIQEVLKRMNIESVAVCSGPEAIAEAKKNSTFDLIVLDMNMPELTGEETYKELRKNNSDSSVIFMSGYDMTEEVQNMNLKNIHRFLKKPFTITDLQKMVNEMLELN